MGPQDFTVHSPRFLAGLIPIVLLGVVGLAAGVGVQNLNDLAKQSLSKIEGHVDLRGLRDSVEVLRDQWGIPHIYAQNLDDLPVRFSLISPISLLNSP